MDWFLYDNGLSPERVKYLFAIATHHGHQYYLTSDIESYQDKIFREIS